MTLKPITLRLDKDEYEKLKGILNGFGDPDINVAYVVRSYVRDLNRALPFLVKSRWDLKNYFGFLGVMLKHFGGMTDMSALAGGMFDWGRFWKGAAGASDHEDRDVEGKPFGAKAKPGPRKGGDAEAN